VQLAAVEELTGQVDNKSQQSATHVKTVVVEKVVSPTKVHTTQVLQVETAQLIQAAVAVVAVSTSNQAVEAAQELSLLDIQSDT
jgi:hypothetical protein